MHFSSAWETTWGCNAVLLLLVNMQYTCCVVRKRGNKETVEAQPVNSLQTAEEREAKKKVLSRSVKRGNGGDEWRAENCRSAGTRQYRTVNMLSSRKCVQRAVRLYEMAKWWSRKLGISVDSGTVAVGKEPAALCQDGESWYTLFPSLSATYSIVSKQAELNVEDTLDSNLKLNKVLQWVLQHCFQKSWVCQTYKATECDDLQK